MARRLLVRALGGLLLLAWLSPGTATTLSLQDQETAAPAAVASPADLDVEASNRTAEDDEGSDEGDLLGSRAGRFLSWSSPHPTIATFTHRASQLSDILRRAAKFLSAFASSQEDDAANNEIDVDSAERKEDRDDESPGAALSGLYSECLLRLSVPCVQRKLLLFLDRLGRMERFRLFGDFLTVVRVEPRNAEARRIVLDEDADVTDLAALADKLVDDFFDTHVLRFSLPGTLRVGRSPRTTVDIHLERPGAAGADEPATQLGEAAEGRSLGEPRLSGKLSGGGGNSKKKQKMIKKIKKKVMKLLMMLMSVLMVMGPMMGGMASNSAGMAGMMGMIALLILKALLIKQMGGSVGTMFSNIGNSFSNLAGIPAQGQGTSYQPTGTGGGPYSRSDYATPYSSYSPYTAYTGRSLGGAWLGGFDPMTLAYRAYAIASHLK